MYMFVEIDLIQHLHTSQDYKNALKEALGSYTWIAHPEDAPIRSVNLF